MYLIYFQHPSSVSDKDEKASTSQTSTKDVDKKDVRTEDKASDVQPPSSQNEVSSQKTQSSEQESSQPEQSVVTESQTSQTSSSPFEDPIDFTLLDESKVDRIVKRQLSRTERLVFVFYKKTEEGEVKVEAFRQVLNDDNEVTVEIDQIFETTDASYEAIMETIQKKFADPADTAEEAEEEVEVEESSDEGDDEAEEEEEEPVVDEQADKGVIIFTINRNSIEGDGVF